MNTVKSHEPNPLYTANQINIHLTEKQTVDATLDALSSAYQPLDKFSMWFDEKNPPLAFRTFLDQKFSVIERGKDFWEVIPKGYSKSPAS